MATAAILNNLTANAQSYAAKTPAPMAASSSGSGSSSRGSDAGTISANDFLTLLVTEMKNQDPTATQDPNEYINQLVQVNSLQQLISINETLTTSLGTSSSSTASTDAARGAGATGAAIQQNTSAALAGQSAPGNIGIPDINPSALGIAHALDGKRATFSTDAASVLR